MSKREQIIKVLDKGLYKEFGLDNIIPKEDVGSGDIQSLDISEVFEPKSVPEKSTEKPVNDPVQKEKVVIPETKPIITEEPDEPEE